jgi:hypothetical protein
MAEHYKIDEELVDTIQNYYAQALDNAGLNVADPIAANIGFFNNSGKVFADPMRLGRTMIFFTRPNLNFASRRNIEKSRVFSYYKSNPLGCTIMRTLMYPETANYMYYGIYGDDKNKIRLVAPYGDKFIGGNTIIEGTHCLPLVESNFNPLLSNACVATSSGRDITLETFETDGNFSGDKLKYANGIDESQTIGELNCEFEDIYPSPLLIIFYLWIMYMHYVGKSICDPYRNYIVHRIIDYTCSIYIFMLGTDNQTIIRWVRYSGCFPINIPFGVIQHNKEPNSEELRRMTIPFAYNFMCAMEPLSLTEFNMVSGPSLYLRLKNIYKLSSREINSLIGEHSMALESAEKILTRYKPIHNNGHMISDASEFKEYKNQLPEKLLYGNNYSREKNIPPFLLNRQNGYIVNNFYGVPYITEGNKLMFV